MTDSSRRNFLKSASIGAAAVGAAAAIPLTASSASAAEPEHTGPAHDGPFMVWVKDAKAGTVSVLVGEHEVVHHDPKLAKRLAQLAARATKS